MLVEFKVKNYLSIREEQVLSMVASPDDSLPDNVTEAGNMRLLKTVGMYGPNASGKSNICLALLCMQRIVSESAVTRPNKALPLTPFKLDELSKDKPSTFEVTFLLDGNRYQYGFSATSKEVTEEWLLFYPNNTGKPQTWIEREKKLFSSEPWGRKPYLKGETASIQKRTRENALFLSVGAQWNNEQLTEVYKWITKSLMIINHEDEVSDVTASILLMDGTQTIQEMVRVFLERVDFGICGVNVEERKFDEVKFPENVPHDLREELKSIWGQRNKTRVHFDHKGEKTKEKYRLHFDVESRGTQRFFRLIGPWIESLLLGRCVVVDELAMNFHPQLTEYLILLMQNPDANKNGCQLIFTTHDTTLMNQDLFRHDQIWFTEKSDIGVTSLYSLADFKGVRKDAAIQRGYLAGRYGAIPILKSFGIDALNE
jgi:uncharacterized protein